MSKGIQAVRGMNDVLPEDSPYWQILESICHEVMHQYAYREIRFPIVEQSALFKRSVGEATDIVEKEMYTFNDRNGDSLTLRPEGTASCMRAVIQHSLCYGQTQRLFYLGPMFRHERPQKGRYRQFYQLGVEAIGMPGPDVDVEVILIGNRIFEELGVNDKLELQINSLGNAESRRHYREVLVEYFTRHQTQLDEDSVRRLESNPLRILDSKNPEMQALIEAAPNMTDYLDEASQQHFARLCVMLEAQNIPYKLNTRLVRGLDYYGMTVFEWVVTTEDGAQNTVCAGGRYDTLIEQLGGKPTPAVGFALGLERLLLLVKEQEKIDYNPDLYFILMGDEARGMGLQFTEQLHDALPHLSIMMDCVGGSYKSQFKRADKSGAHFVVILGEDEMRTQTLSLKSLRSDEPQQNFTFEAFIELFEGD